MLTMRLRDVALFAAFGGLSGWSLGRGRTDGVVVLAILAGAGLLGQLTDDLLFDVRAGDPHKVGSELLMARGYLPWEPLRQRATEMLFVREDDDDDQMLLRWDDRGARIVFGHLSYPDVFEEEGSFRILRRGLSSLVPRSLIRALR